MRPTHILTREHEVLGRFLDTFERMLEVTARSREIPLESLRDGLTFLTEYGDRFHHRRENELFDRLRRIGMGHGERPCAAMERDHDWGRELIRTMQDIADRATPGDLSAARNLVHLGLDYVQHQRQHIEKEDRILFPLITELLPASEDGRILAAFEHIEATLAPRSTTELIDLALDLQGVFGPLESLPSRRA
ncbi:MAG: hemerythrin domain-containing protein [Planctomycetota bacterium]|nr:hemerythrin domain-containing protein [Planctomycetota bacterium]